MPHGEACACGLPAVAKLITPAATQKIKRMGEILGADFNQTESVKDIAEKTANAYKNFINKIGLQTSLPNISADEINKLAKMIENEAFAGLSPVKITTNNALELIKESMM